jgi:hypothetical protein
MIGWKPHAPTGLNGWVGFQNEAVRKRPCLPNNLGLPSMHAVPVERQNRPQPARRQINRGPYQQVLYGPNLSKPSGRHSRGNSEERR